MPHAPLASDATKNNVVTHRTALYFRSVVNGGNNNKYTRLNYDEVFLGYRTPDENRNFLQLRLNSGRVSARDRIRGTENDLTSTVLVPDWTDQYDDVRFVEEQEAVQFARIGFNNL